MNGSFRVTYELTVRRHEDPEAKAQDIALEQTAELPLAALDDEIRRAWIGRLVELSAAGQGRYRAVLDFPVAAVGTDLSQLVNLLYGNISLKEGIRLVDVQWPPELVSDLGGPGRGIDGIRRLVGNVQGRPLLATVLKPLGSSTEALAATAARFARAGVDIVKDDHGLANQYPAPFTRRLEACQEAVAAAGGHTRYFPNVTAAWPVMMERARAAKEAGCCGVLVNLMLTGLDAAAWLRDELGLAVMAHPALAGGLLQQGTGMSPEILLGQLFRMAGADAVIYPNVGGRFGFSAEVCALINDRLRRPLGSLHPAFPVPAGGIDLRRMPAWVNRYGADTIFLIGSSLYTQRDPEASARQLIEALRNGQR